MNTPPPPDIVLPPPESPSSKRIQRQLAGTKEELKEDGSRDDGELKREEEDVLEEVERGRVSLDTMVPSADHQESMYVRLFKGELPL